MTDTLPEDNDELLPPDLQDAQAEARALAKMGGMSLEQVVRAGHEMVLRLLVAKVNAGTIKHQELAILRNMLRDNGMVWSLPPPPIDGEAAPVLPSAEDLPQLEAPDYQ